MPHRGVNRLMPHRGVNRLMPHRGVNRRMPHRGVNRLMPHRGVNRLMPHPVLEHRVDEHEFISARIFNFDEKSHRVLLGSEKVAQKENFQVGGIIACESGRNMTGV